MTVEITASGPTDRPLAASAVLLGDVKRLSAVDGLLLRAEHLDVMQDYALALASGVGGGGGAGVDHGYLLTLKGATLDVSPGLARSTSGRPLVLGAPVAIDLPPPGPAASATSGVYVVVVNEATEPTGGVDQIIGDLCGDPCSCEGGFRPFTAEAVRIEVRPLNLAGHFVDPARANQLRSALAQACFEQERLRHGEPVPRAVGAVDAPASWMGATEIPDPDGPVPIGLLYSTGSDWALDTWAARRDRMELPAHRWWFQRLGLRPLPIFLAQVLQFQGQIAEDPLGSGTSLAAGGFRELPPAGYLPVDPGGGVDGQVEAMFDTAVALRFMSAPIDEIGLALEQARHLDRVPLTETDKARRPRVDILVPDGILAPEENGSTVQFARATVRFERRPPHSVAAVSDGLARMERIAAGPLIIAIAGIGFDGDERLAVWLDGRLSSDLLALTPGATCEVDLRIAGTPEAPAQAVAARLPSSAPGGARLRVDLKAHFYCTGRRVDGAQTTALDGTLSARLNWRSGKSTVEETVYTSEAATIEIGHAVDAVTVRVKLVGGVDLVTAISTGGWPTDIKVDIGRLHVTAQLVADGSAILAGKSPRVAADTAIVILGKTDLPSVADKFLYAGAALPRRSTTFRTPHDWVFFTRRHQRDTSGDQSRTTAVMLDVYTLVMPAASIEAVLGDPGQLDLARTPARFATQARWHSDTVQLDQQSRIALEAWHRANADLSPRGALVWFVRQRLPAEYAVGQALEPMRTPPLERSLRIVPVDGLPPLAMTPGSSGVVLVLVERWTR